MRIACEIPMGGITLTPEVRATWQHEFGDRTFATTAEFGFGGPDFTVQSPEIGRDTFVLNAGFTLQLSPIFGAHAYYHGDFGTSNYDAHSIFVGARMSF
jgi:outer membrane autotransporter protein